MKRRNFLGGLGAAVVASAMPVRAEEYFEKLKAEVEGGNPEVIKDDVPVSYSASTSFITDIYGPPMPDSLLKAINENKKIFDVWGGK